MSDCINSSNPKVKLIENYVNLAFNYEQHALTIFEKVSLCSNKLDSIDKLISSFVEADYYCIRTKNVKYPKTLLQFADGNASPNMYLKLKNIINGLTLLDTTKYCSEMYKQLLYNAMRGNRNAIERIKYEMNVLDCQFNINYTDSNNMNVLKLALGCNNKPKFISYLLSYPDIKLSDDVYDYALESKLCYTNINDYITILGLLVSKYIPLNFLSKYFEKKSSILENFNEGSSNNSLNLFCKLEELLLVDGIEDYFEMCDHPMLMAKLWCVKLRNKINNYEKQTNENNVIITGCDGNKVAIACCIHGATQTYTSASVFCSSECPGHKIL